MFLMAWVSTKTGAILNNNGRRLYQPGELDRAEQLYRQAKFHFEQAGDRFNSAVALGNNCRHPLPSGKPARCGEHVPGDHHTVTATIRADPSYAMYRLADLELAEGRLRMQSACQAGHRHSSSGQGLGTNTSRPLP